MDVSTTTFEFALATFTLEVFPLLLVRLLDTKRATANAPASSPYLLDKTLVGWFLIAPAAMAAWRYSGGTVSSSAMLTYDEDDASSASASSLQSSSSSWIVDVLFLLALAA